MNIDQPWIKALDAIGTGDAIPAYGTILLDKFSSTCFYFGEGLLDGLGDLNVPIGLIHTAWGGSTIEEWLTNEEIAKCQGATIADDNGRLFDSNVKPYIDMSVKGWVRSI